MKNFIAKIMSPETLKKAKKNFNLDLYKVITDAQTKGKNPFEDAVVAIMKATKGDQKAIGDLFQDMQVQNFIRPMIQNWQEYQRIKDKVLTAKGVTDRDFEKMMATARKQMDGVTNAAGRLGIAIGAALLPIFGKIAAAVTPVIDAFTTFATNNSELVANIVTGATVFGTLRVALLGVGLAWRVMTAGMMGNPIGLIVTAIATGAVLIYENWDKIKQFFVDMWPVVKEAFSTAWAWIEDKFLKYHPIGIIISNWEPIKGYFQGLWNDITATFKTALEWITSKIDWVGEKWRAAKSFVGIGDDTAPAATPSTAPAAALPPPPAMAQRSGASGGWTDNSQNTFNITQLPGESTEALARRIADEQERRRQVQMRSRAYDGATP